MKGQYLVRISGYFCEGFCETSRCQNATQTPKRSSVLIRNKDTHVFFNRYANLKPQTKEFEKSLSEIESMKKVERIELMKKRADSPVGANKIEKILTKDGSVVHPMSNMQETGSVLRDYSATLVLVDLRDYKNLFYSMQIIKTNTKPAEYE
jgi:hypothetical protein